MNLDRALRTTGWLCVGVLASAVAVSAVAGPKSPASAVGPMVTPVLPTTGPQYSPQFNCQVGKDTLGRVCYDPYQMRTAYNIDTQIAMGYDGRGRTIVILDAFQSPNIQQQINFFSNNFQIPGLNGTGNPDVAGWGRFTQVAPDGLTPFDPTDGNMIGWAIEISLDVEWSHAIAPGANIVLVLARSNSDADLMSAFTYAVRNRLGDVISMSFGENERCLDQWTAVGWHNAFVAATQAGITLMASSGDEGAAQGTCDGISWTQAPSSPATDNLVTAVGGTELIAAKYCLTSQGCNPATNPAAGTYQSESAWNEGLPYGDFGNLLGFGTDATGGGFSTPYGLPSYQRASVGGYKRGVPDVAYNAAIFHGVITYLNIPGFGNGFNLVGGTSAGAPQWSAITAIANQKSGRQLGFLNTGIYRIAQGPLYSTSFHDVTVGQNNAGEVDAYGNQVLIPGFNAGLGWDPTTGVGSPNASLVDNLINNVTPWDGLIAISTTLFSPQSPLVQPGFMAPH